MMDYPFFLYTDEELDIGIKRMFYFTQSDKFIGAMRARRLARPKFERWKRHECLIAQRGRAVWRHAQRNAALH